MIAGMISSSLSADSFTSTMADIAFKKNILGLNNSML
jgi:hypothetical protein